MKKNLILSLFILPSLAFGNEAEWKNLLPAKTEQLDAAWQEFGEQASPSDKPLPKVRTKTWHIDAATGSIMCAGESYGVLLTREAYADYELECEFRYLPKEGETGWEGQKKGNSGIFVRNDRSLPETLFLMHQVELATSNAFARLHGGRVSSDGTLYRMAEKVARDGKWVDEQHHIPGRFKSSIKTTVEAPWPDPGPELPAAGRNIEHPLNEWNHYRITCVGPVIRVFLNGEPVSVVANAQALTGGIGVESEGRPFEIKTFRVRELKEDKP